MFNLHLYLYEIVIFFHLLYLLFSLPEIRKTVLVKNKFVLVLIILNAVVFLFNWGKFSLYQDIVALLYFGRLILYYLYFYSLSLLFRKDDSIKKRVELSLNCAFAIIFIISFLQYVFYPNFFLLSYLGWDKHLYRVVGTFFDAYLAAAVLGILFFFFLERKNIIGSLISLLFLIGTFSRSAILSLLLTLPFFQRSVKRVFLLLAFLVLTIILIPKPGGEGVNLLRTYSISSRFNNWKEGVLYLKKSPLLGIGYNHLPFARSHSSLKELEHDHSLSSFHSSYLTLLCSLGIMGFLFALYLFFRIWRFSPIKSILAFVFLFSLFDNVILHPFVIFLVGVIELFEFSLRESK